METIITRTVYDNDNNITDMVITRKVKEFGNYGGHVTVPGQLVGKTVEIRFTETKPRAEGSETSV